MSEREERKGKERKYFHPSCSILVCISVKKDPNCSGVAVTNAQYKHIVVITTPMEVADSVAT